MDPNDRTFYNHCLSGEDCLTDSLDMRKLKYHSVAKKSTDFWGWFFVMFGSVFFVAFLYATIVSKLLPPLQNPILAAIQRDSYYCFLVPLTLPVLVVAVYFHWLSMKLFKHA